MGDASSSRLSLNRGQVLQCGNVREAKDVNPGREAFFRIGPDSPGLTRKAEKGGKLKMERRGYRMQSEEQCGRPGER
jgi:hypothetical protein